MDTVKKIYLEGAWKDIIGNDAFYAMLAAGRVMQLTIESEKDEQEDMQFLSRLAVFIASETYRDKVVGNYSKGWEDAIECERRLAA